MKGRWNHQWLARKDHNLCGDLRKKKLGEVQNGWQTFLWRVGFEVTIWKPKGGIHYRKMLEDTCGIHQILLINSHLLMFASDLCRPKSRQNYMCFFKRYYSWATHRCLESSSSTSVVGCNTISLNKSQVDNVSPHLGCLFLNNTICLSKSQWNKIISTL